MTGEYKLSKSYVSSEHHVCPICTTKHSTGTILLNREMRDTMERDTVTGWGLCGECNGHRQNDMVALVGAVPERSTLRSNGNINPDDAYRTGDVLWMRTELFNDIFDVPAPDGGMCFVDPETVQLCRQVEMAALTQPEGDNNA